MYELKKLFKTHCWCLLYSSNIRFVLHEISNQLIMSYFISLLLVVPKSACQFVLDSLMKNNYTLIHTQHCKSFRLNKKNKSI